MSQIIGNGEIVSEITISAVNLECTRVGGGALFLGFFSIYINSGVILIISFMLLGASGARLQNSRSVLSFGHPGKHYFWQRFVLLFVIYSGPKQALLSISACVT